MTNLHRSSTVSWKTGVHHRGNVLGGSSMSQLWVRTRCSGNFCTFSVQVKSERNIVAVPACWQGVHPAGSPLDATPVATKIWKMIVALITSMAPCLDAPAMEGTRNFGVSSRVPASVNGFWHVNATFLGIRGELILLQVGHIRCHIEGDNSTSILLWSLTYL